MGPQLLACSSLRLFRIPILGNGAPHSALSVLIPINSEDIHMPTGQQEGRQILSGGSLLR